MALEIGQRVRILIDSPTGEPVEGMVAVYSPNNRSGKKVGVELDHFALNGHTLDGKVNEDEKVDPATGARYGKGWWTLEDNVEVI